MQNQSLLAIDPSLTASGWAKFSIKSGALEEFGVLNPPGTKLSLPERLKALQEMVVDLFLKLGLAEGDFLLCEGPAPLVKNPDSATKVEQVRGVFETLARVNGLVVPGRINPRTIHTEVLGFRGPQVARKDVKLIARETASRLFGEVVHSATQDSVDAMLVGSYATGVLSRASKTGESVYSLFSPKTAGGGRRSQWTRALGSRAIKKVG